MEQSERDKLVLDNMRLVYYTYERLSQTDMIAAYKDDIIQEGMVGLVKAAKNFDPSKGFKFATFAVRCIRNEMFMFMRSLRKSWNTEVSLYTVVGQDKEGNETYLEDTLEDVEHDPQRETEKKLLQEFLASQKPSDRQIAEYICQGYTQREIAQKMQMLQPTVSRRISKLKKRAKKELAN